MISIAPGGLGVGDWSFGARGITTLLNIPLGESPCRHYLTINAAPGHPQSHRLAKYPLCDLLCTSIDSWVYRIGRPLSLKSCEWSHTYG